MQKAMMKNKTEESRGKTIARVVHFTSLIYTNRRITIRKVEQELGVSKSTVYRLIDAATTVIPMKIEKGVIVRL